METRGEILLAESLLNSKANKDDWKSKNSAVTFGTVICGANLFVPYRSADPDTLIAEDSTCQIATKRVIVALGLIGRS